MAALLVVVDVASIDGRMSQTSIITHTHLPHTTTAGRWQDELVLSPVRIYPYIRHLRHLVSILRYYDGAFTPHFSAETALSRRC